MNTSRLRLTGDKDKLFAATQFPRKFSFNEEVAEVFDDMVTRSVPFYREAIDILLQWADARLPTHARVYDLGCSTGTTLDALGRTLKHPAELIGLDTSEPMLDVARAKLDHVGRRHKVRLELGDARQFATENAHLVVLNYTLQFVPVQYRQDILASIRQNMQPEGFLFISEKISGASKDIHATTTWIYENFKHSAGYSRDEISRKKEALENVLVPMTLTELGRSLENAGFSSWQPVLLWNNFVSIVAVP